MQHAVLSGIRPSFPGLSQSAGQITHVLLTRSPLESPQRALSVRLACVKHAASVRPEPGSNSPNKTQQGQPEKLANQRNLTKTRHTPNTGTPGAQQKNNKTKTTKHTIEFSNNTPGLRATLPVYSTAQGASIAPRGHLRPRGRVRYSPVYALLTRSISAPKLTRFSTNSG